MTINDQKSKMQDVKLFRGRVLTDEGCGVKNWVEINFFKITY